MTYQSQLTELRGMIEKIEYYKYTTDALIYWDKITYMPRNAIEYRSKVMSFLAESNIGCFLIPDFRS